MYLLSRFSWLKYYRWLSVQHTYIQVPKTCQLFTRVLGNCVSHERSCNFHTYWGIRVDLQAKASDTSRDTDLAKLNWTFCLLRISIGPIIVANNVDSENISFCMTANTPRRARGLIVLRLINEALWAVTHAAAAGAAALSGRAYQVIQLRNAFTRCWWKTHWTQFPLDGSYFFFPTLRAASPQQKRCGPRDWLRSRTYTNT